MSVKTAVKIKGDVRREQIVQAALKIIARKGVGYLTTAGIAREVGISEANLYRHFKNKDDIYSAAVQQVRFMIVGNLEKVLAGNAEPLAALKQFFSLQLEMMETNSGIPRLMFSEELHIHKTMREHVLDTLYSVSEKLSVIIRKGQQAGSIRDDIHPLTTVLMFVAMIQGLTFRWSLENFSFSLKAEGSKTWKNFETCIAKP